MKEHLFYLIAVLLMPGTLVKSYSATDLTSDFTSAVDDQYPWSALAQRKGPNVQDAQQWKWTDRSERGPIDRFLHGSKDEHSSGQITEDKGPGSLEIYQLTNLDLNTIPLPPWNNPSSKMVENKEIYNEYKKPALKMKKSRLREKQRTPKDSQVVPELQIGCEGLEGPMETPRGPRSAPQNDPSLDIPPVNPVTIDWDYSAPHYEEMDELLKLKNLEKILNKEVRARGDMRPDQDSDFEDHRKVPLRGDLVSSRKIRSILEDSNPKSSWRSEGLWGFGENDGYISDDENPAERRRQEYLRARNQELERRRKEELERQKSSRRPDNQINSEIERIRKEYDQRLSEEQRDRERKLREYIERNRPIVVENRGGVDQRGFEEFMRRSGGISRDRSRGPSPPSGPARSDQGLRREEEARRREEEVRRIEELKRREEEEVRRQEELKRRDEELIRRQEELKRREEEAKRRVDETARRDEELKKRQEELKRREEEAKRRVGETGRRDEELKKRQEEIKRREEEAKRRVDETRRRFGESGRRDDELKNRQEEQQRRKDEENRRKQMENRHHPEQRRREFGTAERRKDSGGRNADLYRRVGDDRIMEQKQRVPGVISLDEVERRRSEEMRLNSLPVSARIFLRPGSATEGPIFGSRGLFEDDDDSTGINPNRPGLNAGRFPAARTPKPPSNPPGACVWAVVQCCPNGDQRRLNNCFEYLGCPGVNWDPNPCRSALSDAARSQVAQYYASADEPL